MVRGWIGHFAWLAAFAISASLTATLPATAQQVVAMVNGSPITAYDIDQRTKFVQLSAHKVASRKEVLDALIEEKIKIQEAQRYNMDAGKAEVERGVGMMSSRAGLNIEQFTQYIARSGISIETIKTRMRAEVAWNQLIRARFPATLAIEDKEIRDAAQSVSEGEDVSYDYRLRQILFIVPSGSPKSLMDNRMREAENLRSRFENCEDGVKIARTLRDVAVRDPVRRSSNDLPESMRNVINSTQMGKLTKPEVTGQGVAVFALCEKRENTTDTPKKQKAKTDLFNTRFDAVSKRYLADLKRSAIIEMK
jgi:peptidyl-prolyl cis-trans isomerase SurA